MLVATAICGVVFSLAAGQPLVIIGATGPVLVFEEALFKVPVAFVDRLITCCCCFYHFLNVKSCDNNNSFF